MRKLIILSVAALISLAIACKKDPEVFKISGSVSNNQTAKPVSGAEVYLDAKKIEGGVYNASFTNITRAITDGNGNYNFDIEEEKIATYRFRVFVSGYFEHSEEVEVNELQASSSYTKNFGITEEAWIQLHVKNTKPYDSEDRITYRFKNIEVSGKDCCSNVQQSGTGISYESTTLCKAQGNDWIQLEWVVSKRGSQKIYSDSIRTIPGETANYNLYY